MRWATGLAALERRLAGLPVVKHRDHEVVLTEGAKTGELLFLRSGTVEVVKDGVQIASVNAGGSVFGELAVLLDQPHAADVRTLEASEFYVADSAILISDPPSPCRDPCATTRRRQPMACRG
jgi:CRP/FNR family transcriptional regulator, cyclic AMP receptor protein